jgi:hypothetical protein
MNPDSPTEEQDREVIEFCLALLRSDREMSYREARKEARTQKGYAVRRQLWSAARREAGITGRDDDDTNEQSHESEMPQHRGDRHGRPDDHRYHSTRCVRMGSPTMTSGMSDRSPGSSPSPIGSPI